MVKSIALVMHDAGDADGLWPVVQEAIDAGVQVNCIMSDFISSHKSMEISRLLVNHPRLFHIFVTEWDYQTRNDPIPEQALDNILKWPKLKDLDALIVAGARKKLLALIHKVEASQKMIYFDYLGELNEPLLNNLKICIQEIDGVWVSHGQNKTLLERLHVSKSVHVVGHGSISNDSYRKLKRQQIPRDGNRVLWVGGYDDPNNPHHPHVETECLKAFMPCLTALIQSGVVVHIAVHPGEVPDAHGEYLAERILKEAGYDDFQVSVIVIKPSPGHQTIEQLCQYDHVVSYLSTLSTVALMLEMKVSFFASSLIEQPDLSLDEKLGLAKRFKDPIQLLAYIKNGFGKPTSLPKDTFFAKRQIPEEPGQVMLSSLQN